MKKPLLCLATGALSSLALVSFAHADSQKSLSLFDFVAFATDRIEAECSDYLGRVGSGHNVNFRNFLVQGPKVEECAIFAEGAINTYQGSIEARKSSASASRLACVSARVFNPNGTAYSFDRPDVRRDVKFDRVKSEMLSLSQWLSTGAVEKFGLTSVKNGNTFEAKNTVSVFNLDASELERARNLVFQGNENSVFVVNVLGSAAEMTDLGIKMIGAVRTNHILINFPHATVVRIQHAGVADSVYGRRIGIPATIVAPNARVVFNDALITGALFAKEILGQASDVACQGSVGGQINPGCFDGGSELAIGCSYTPGGGEKPAPTPSPTCRPTPLPTPVPTPSPEKPEPPQSPKSPSRKSPKG